MLITLALSTALATALQDTDGPRDWKNTDPGVHFVEGTRPPQLTPVGSWTGEEWISVRCTILADGGLDDCDVVDQSSGRERLSHRSARVGVGRLRLALGERGPQPGDTLTVTITFTMQAGT